MIKCKVLGKDQLPPFSEAFSIIRAEEITGAVMLESQPTGGSAMMFKKRAVVEEISRTIQDKVRTRLTPVNSPTKMDSGAPTARSLNIQRITASSFMGKAQVMPGVEDSKDSSKRSQSC